MFEASKFSPRLIGWASFRHTPEVAGRLRVGAEGRNRRELFRRAGSRVRSDHTQGAFLPATPGSYRRSRLPSPKPVSLELRSCGHLARLPALCR